MTTHVTLTGDSISELATVAKLNNSSASFEHLVNKSIIKIKLCLRGAHNCAQLLFSCHDLDINPMTLKLEVDLDILKMYLHAKNEVARLRHLKLLITDEISMANEKMQKIAQGQTSPTQTTSSVHHRTCSYKVTSTADK